MSLSLCVSFGDLIRFWAQSTSCRFGLVIAIVYETVERLINSVGWTNRFQSKTSKTMTWRSSSKTTLFEPKTVEMGFIDEELPDDVLISIRGRQQQNLDTGLTQQTAFWGKELLRPSTWKWFAKLQTSYCLYTQSKSFQQSTQVYPLVCYSKLVLMRCPNCLLYFVLFCRS